MANPTQVSWTDPTTNTDGSPLAAGEITGYQVGLRLQSGVAGTYGITINAPATATSAPLPSPLAAGTYIAAVRALTASGASAWSAESASFTTDEIPNPPTAVAAS